MTLLNITEEQITEIGSIMAANWGCHAQTGYSIHPPDGDPQTITLWIKMGPHLPARAFDIQPDGTVTTEPVEWDGRAPR